jgi:hypothetical protein
VKWDDDEPVALHYYCTTTDNLNLLLLTNTVVVAHSWSSAWRRTLAHQPQSAGAPRRNNLCNRKKEREAGWLADWLTGRQLARSLTPSLLSFFLSFLPRSLPSSLPSFLPSFSLPAVGSCWSREHGNERARHSSRSERGEGESGKNRRGRRAQESVGPAKEAGQGRRKMVACPLALGPLDSRRETMGGNAREPCGEPHDNRMGAEGSVGDAEGTGGTGRNGGNGGDGNAVAGGERRPSA